jgi:hypothetical protein
MPYKAILEELELPKYNTGGINNKIPKNIKYGNTARFGIKLLNLEDPILKWKKFTKYIPKPQDYRSNGVKKELLFLKNVQDNLDKKDIKRIYKLDRPSNINYIELLKENGYSPSTKKHNLFSLELGHLILKLKMHYQRPRAFQISHYHNIKLNPLDSTSAWTPAYPSGHGFQAYFWYKFYSIKYPKMKKKLKRFAKEMADSRIHGGYHYPSDNLISKKLVNIIFKKKLHISLEKKLKEKYNM